MFKVYSCLAASVTNYIYISIGFQAEQQWIACFLTKCALHRSNYYIVLYDHYVIVHMIAKELYRQESILAIHHPPQTQNNVVKYYVLQIRL